MQDNYLGPVSEASVEERSDFIWKCYAHVVAAILIFAGISAYLISSGVSASIYYTLFPPEGGGMSWLLVLGAFMLVSWGASHIAHTVQSTQLQYGAFALLIVAEALLFAPILFLASALPQFDGVIDAAAGVTVLGCAALIGVVMITRKDFSFLRGILMWGFALALVAIVGAVLFGFELGTWFSVAMIGFAGAAVLYDTSNILHHYPQDRYVAASMQLFASIALMFWYVLQFFMSRD
ncbi:MAG: Bax inhibitor-1 family protein [Pseudomonadota bacterium]